MSSELGILLDFNGVMVDDYHIQKSSWTQIAIKLRGFDVSDDEMVNQIRGRPTVETVRRMSEGRNLSSEEINDIARQKDIIVQELFRSSPLAKLSLGLTDFLEDLKRHSIPMAVVSSSSLQNLNIIFERFELHQFFDNKNIIHKDSTYEGRKIRNKPEPDPYLAGSKIIQVQPNRCVVFEDAKSGVESAKRAGIEKIIAVNTNLEHLLELTKIPCVIKGVSNFTEVDYNFLRSL